MFHILIVAVLLGVGVALGQRLVTGRRTPPGWYVDPWKLHWMRYWTGCQWTGWTYDADAPARVPAPTGKELDL